MGSGYLLEEDPNVCPALAVLAFGSAWADVPKSLDAEGRIYLPSVLRAAYAWAMSSSELIEPVELK